ncbi:hypothetical protein Ancab_001667 [Ancistrocladus abbreviatus]
MNTQRNPDIGVNRVSGEQRKSEPAKCSTNKSYAEALGKDISSPIQQPIQSSTEDTKTPVAKMTFTVSDEEIQWLQGVAWTPSAVDRVELIHVCHLMFFSLLSVVLWAAINDESLETPSLGSPLCDGASMSHIDPIVASGGKAGVISTSNSTHHKIEAIWRLEHVRGMVKF